MDYSSSPALAIAIGAVPTVATFMAEADPGISYAATLDEGATWLPLAPNATTSLAALPEGTVLRYRADLPEGACIDTLGVGWR